MKSELEAGSSTEDFIIHKSFPEITGMYILFPTVSNGPHLRPVAGTELFAKDVTSVKAPPVVLLPTSKSEFELLS